MRSPQALPLRRLVVNRRWAHEQQRGSPLSLPPSSFGEKGRGGVASEAARKIISSEAPQPRTMNYLSIPPRRERLPSPHPDGRDAPPSPTRIEFYFPGFNRSQMHRRSQGERRRKIEACDRLRRPLHVLTNERRRPFGTQSVPPPPPSESAPYPQRVYTVGVSDGVAGIRGTIPPQGRGLRVGQYAETSRNFSPDQVRVFGELIGDRNPLHGRDDDDKRAPAERQAVVHGMLVASLFSSIFGTLVPGAVYRSQTLRFRAPVFANEVVVGRVVVTNVKVLRRGVGIGVGGSSETAGSHKSETNIGGVMCTCDTAVVKRRAATTDSTNFVGGINDEIECIIGKAQVWLPGATVAVET